VTSSSTRPIAVVATANRGKLAEIRAILESSWLEIGSLEGHAPIEFPPESGDYEANAVQKARTVATRLGVLALADDSGLEVDALDRAPGAYSARFGGQGLDDAGRVTHLLQTLAHVAPAARGARFVCYAAAAAADGRVWCVRGECRGQILRTPVGEGGFGYDPVFQPEGHTRAMAELAPFEKHAISHRGRAFRALADELRASLAGGPGR
jgi:XTP/dITP diphosphohydrolase